MGNKGEKFDYEKRIADYRASTDQNALEWRAAVLGMDEKEQKRAYFRFMVADDGSSVVSTVVPDTSRRWILITSARIEKRKADEHL